MDKVIELAKTFERRRCGHKPEDYAEPLSNLECMKSCVDDGTKGENRHRYIVASQDAQLRRLMRDIPGVPLIYIVRVHTESTYIVANVADLSCRQEVS